MLTCCAATGATALDIDIGPDRYRLELATSVEQRRLGLMHRRELGRHEGMLLVYPRSGDHRIWMKNVHVVLRVYWLDETFTVVDMQRLEPCRADPCPIYAADRPARYVLELADYPHALQLGDRLNGVRLD